VCLEGKLGTKICSLPLYFQIQTFFSYWRWPSFEMWCCIVWQNSSQNLVIFIVATLRSPNLSSYIFISQTLICLIYWSVWNMFVSLMISAIFRTAKCPTCLEICFDSPVLNVSNLMTWLINDKKGTCIIAQKEKWLKHSFSVKM
jgi:hypothetical protein